MLPAFLTTILFSISAVCANRTAKIMGGSEANFWRLVVAAVLLAAVAHGWGSGLTGDSFPFFLCSGFVGFGLGDIALFHALPRLGSRLTVLIIHCMAAPLAFVTEWMWLGTRLTGSQIACGAGILLGVALALAPREHLHIARRDFIVGLLLALVASFGQGLGAVLSRKAEAVSHLAGQNIDGVTAAYQRIIGGVIVGGLFLLLMRRHEIMERLGGTVAGAKDPEWGLRWRRAWVWILANAVAGPALGVSCFQWALKTSPSGIVLPVVAITPLVIIPFAWHMENERPSWRSLAGGLVAVACAAGLAWVSTR